MSNNQKGFTIFELLISISVGSVIIMMLMSILTSTLVARNEIDYSNKLNNQAYFVNETLTLSFRELGFRSIADISPDNQTDYYTFVLTEEYEFELIGGEVHVNWIHDQYILNLDLIEGALYYGPYAAFNQETWAFENPQSHVLNYDPNIAFTENSSMSFECLGTFKLAGVYRGDLYSECANAFIELNFEMTYTVRGGSALPPRRYYSSLFY